MTEHDSFTYAKAGIDLKATDAVKKEMGKSMQTDNERMLHSAGAFASLYDFKFDEYDHPVLVMKTEEPGSKQLLAFQTNRVKSICYDMVHHLINDIIVMGARPLAVQDAIICGMIDEAVLRDIVDAIAAACREQDCVLTGGETSIQPGVLKEGSYILTSSIVGVVDKRNIIDGAAIREGDVVLAIPSGGLHTNGYTIVRALMEQKPDMRHTLVDGEAFIDAIMRPHLCYYKALRDLFVHKVLHGMAHITGGGIQGNLGRILPRNVNAVIDLSAIRILPVFHTIRQEGQVEDQEMLNIFNMGVGMALVADAAAVQPIQAHLSAFGHSSYVIGEITAGQGEVVCHGKLDWKV
ncbi:phosphoribosylformylglycinamidine cyclo-ligase [Paenibacillus tarimensis]